MDHTMWKGIENCAKKWCLFFVYHFVWGHLGVLKDVYVRNEMTTSKYCWTWTSFYMHGSKKVLKHSCVLNVGSFDTLSIRRCWSSWRKWRMIRIERWGHLTSERTTLQSWQNHQRLFRNLYRRDTVSLLPFLQVFDMITTCRTNSIQTARTFGIY